MYSHLLLFSYPLPIEADNERNEHESSRSMQSFIIFFFSLFFTVEMRHDEIEIFSRVVFFSLLNLFPFLSRWSGANQLNDFPKQFDLDGEQALGAHAMGINCIQPRIACLTCHIFRASIPRTKCYGNEMYVGFWIRVQQRWNTKPRSESEPKKESKLLDFDVVISGSFSSASAKEQRQKKNPY